MHSFINLFSKHFPPPSKEAQTQRKKLTKNITQSENIKKKKNNYLRHINQRNNSTRHMLKHYN